MTHRLFRIACCLALLLITELAAAVAFAAPVITSISRASGPPAGRTPITITGTDFVNGATVTFGGTAAHDVVVASSTSITCAAPAHAAGVVSLVVTNPDEQSASASYAYVLPSADGNYGAAVVGDAPVAFYRFDDTGATSVASDLSGNDFHASLAGGVTPGASGAVGNGSAYTFDGSSGYLELPGSWGGASWQQLTVEAWVNVAASNSDFEAVVSSIDAGFAHIQLSSGGNMVVYSDSGAVNLPPVPQSPGGGWRHLVVVAEPGNSRLYVDGALAGTDGTPFNSIALSSSVRIGSGYQNGRFFNGRIDEVAIYDKALTDAQVASHYSARAVPDVHWVNPAGGNWSVASNWSGGAVPTSTDDVYIDATGTYTVTVDVAAAAGTIAVASGATLQLPGSTLTLAAGGSVASGATLRLAGGTLNDSGPMSVSGTFDWSGGTISGSGTLTIGSGASLSLSGSTYKDLIARRIDLSGVMTWQGYPLRTSGGAALHILPGGLFDIQTDYGIESCCSGGSPLATYVYAASAPQPAGTLRKSAGTGETYLYGLLNNDGLVSVTSGTLVVYGGGTSSGLFQASPSSGSASVHFSGQPHTVTGTLDSNSLGSIAVNGATVTFSGSVTSTARFILAGGTFTGTGTFTSNGTFDWTGGTIAGSGVLDIPATKTLTLSANAYKDVVSRTINISGTLVWQGYPIRASGGAVLNILAGALLDVQTDHAFQSCCSGGTAPAINVSATGRIVKSAGTGETIFYAAVNNAGVVSAATGTMNFAGPVTSSGLFEVKPPTGTADIHFSTSTHSLSGNFDGTTGGTIAFVSGTVSIDGPVTANADLLLYGGTLTGTGALQSNGSFRWVGGAIAGSGSISFAAGTVVTVNGNSYKDITSRTLNLSGTMNWSDYPMRGSSGATLNVLPGGSLVVKTDYGIQSCCSGGTAMTINVSAAVAPNPAGRIDKQVATGETLIQAVLNNHGEIAPTSGTLSFGSGGSSSGTFMATSAGSTPGVIFAGGTHELTGSLGGNSNGTIGVSNGIANFNGTFSAGPTIAISGGTANFNASATTAGVSLSGGSLSGTGTVTATSTFAWSGGSMAGTGSVDIASGATMTLSNSTYKDVVARTINVSGTMIWTGYPIRASGGATLNVLAGGVFDVRTDYEIQSCCSGGTMLTIAISAASGATPAGRMTKSVATGITPIAAVLDNDGVVAPSTGTLAFAGGGTSSGSFVVSSAAGTPGVLFTNGTHELTGSVGGDGDGVIGVSGGTTNFNGAFTGGPTISVSGGVANVNASVSTAAISLSGGSLAGTGTITATSSFTWTGGTLDGNGAIEIPSGSTMTLQNTTYKDLRQRTIDIAGTMIWEGYPLRGSLGPTLNVLAGGTFDVRTDYEVQHCCSGGAALTINVGPASSPLPAGVMTKSVSGGSTYFNAVLNNDGVVSPSNGTLTFGAGGTSAGAFNATSGGTIAFSGGTHALTGSLGGDPGGVILVNGATANINGTFTSGPTISVSSGTANFGANASTATINLSGGTLSGSGHVAATSAFNWSGGQLSGAGTVTIPSGATFSLTGTTYKDLAQRTVNLSGLMIWQGYPLRASLGATINVLAGGVFDVQTDYEVQSCCSGGGPLTLNISAANGSTAPGKLIKSASSGANPINAILNNNGLVAPSTGTLTFAAGGTHAGTFDVNGAAAPAVAFSGGTHTFTGPLTGSSSGNGTIVFNGATAHLNGNFTAGPRVDVSSGTVTVNGAIGIGKVNLLSGTLSVNGTLTPETAFDWTGGQISGIGTLDVPSGATMTLDANSYKDLTLANWSNRGTVLFKAYPLRASAGAAFVNHPSGLFDIQTDYGIQSCCSGGAKLTITNQGTIRKSVGTGTNSLDVNLTNNGTVDVQRGRIALASGYTQGPSPATLKTTIAGPTADADYGVVAITGAAVLDGVFEAVLANGYTPATSSTYTPLTFTSATGDFATQNGLVFPGGSFGYARNADNVTLTATGCTAPPATITVPATACPNQTGIVASVADTSGATYSWTISNGTITAGAGTRSITFDAGPADPVTLTVTIAVPGCQNSGSTTVTISSPQPAITAGGPTTFCAGGSVTLDAGVGYSSYLWSNGATGQTITVGTTGNYTVTVTNGSGCSGTSGPVSVNVTPAGTTTTLTSSLNPSTAGQSVTFNAAVSGSGCTPSGAVGTAVIDGTMTSGEWASARTIDFPVDIGGTQPVPGTLYLMTDAANLYVGLKVDSIGMTSGSFTMEFPASGCSGSDVFVYNFAAGMFDSFRDASCNPVSDTSAGGTNDGVGANGTTPTFTFYEISRPLSSGDAGHDIAAAAGDSLPFTASVRYCPGSCIDSTVPSSVLVVGNATPTGSVTFFDGTSPLGSVGVVNGHATLTVSSLAAGTHAVTAQYDGDATFSGSASPVVNQTVQATCPASISVGGPTAFCAGGSVVLTASSGASYQWLLDGSPISSANSQTLTVGAAGSYSVHVTTSSGCSATSPAVTVTVHSATAPTISASGPTSFCPGGSVTLTSSAAHSYQWFDGSTPLATSQAITVTAGESYSVSIVDANGCSASSAPVSVTVTQAPTPTITASGPTSFCSGGSVTLTASTGASYQWFDGANAIATTQSLVASASGQYSVVVTQSGGCSAQSAPVTITVKPTPATPVATNSGPACPGGSVTLSATTVAGATYSWAGPNGFTSTAQNPTLSGVDTSHAGNYLVTVTVEGCTSPAASTAVVINAAPIAAITGPSAVCSGGSGSATLDAGAGFASYLWSTGATTQTITVSPTTTATYGVTVTNASGCSASTSKTVSVNSTAAPTITAAGPTSFCSGGSVTLTASAGASYQWFDGTNAITSATSQALVASTSGNYSVVVTQSGGCSAQSAPLAITVKPTPAAPVATNSGPACAGGSIALSTATIDGATYNWTGPNGFTSTAQNPTLTSVTASHAGSYVVTATVGGCPSPAAATTVVVTPTPSVSITAPASVCAATTGHLAEVLPQEGATYAWSISNGRIVSATDTPSIRFEASRSGQLTLQVTVSISGCQSVGSTTLVATEPPEVAIFAPSSVAAGSAGNRAGSIPRPNATYGWTIVNGTITAGQGTDSIEFTASNAGAVILGVDVNVGGCASAATVDIAICSTTPPTLLAPAENASNVTSPVALQWTAVEGATGYELWLDSGSGPSLSSTVTSTTASVAVPTGTTSWYVVARPSGDCAPLRSATRRFTVASLDSCAQNPVPVLTSPAAGATTSQDVTFVWNAVAGAIGYRIIVRVDGGAPQDVGSTTSATTLTARVPAGAVAAAVEALFGGCPPTVSTPVLFTATAPDPCAGRAIPTATSPANQATLASATVQFAWLTVAGAIDYRVMIRQGEADAVELGRTSATTFTSIVEPGSFNWWIEALFAGCASTASPERTFTVPPAQTCPTTAATLTSPPSGASVSSASIAFVWNTAADAIGYELWASHAGGAPTLLGSTGPTVVTLTRNAAAGVTEWFVRTLYDRCAPVDSERRTFTYTPPPDCDSGRAALLLAPGEAETAVSPVTFRWSGVEGAARYELFASSGSGEPALLFAGSSLTPAAIEIPPGRIRWFVRSHFEGCGFRDSTPAALTVIAPPPPCQPLGIPTISAPAQISSGIRFAIRWNQVPGATGYVVQTAADGQFSSPLSVNVGAESGNSYELEELNRGAQPRPVYVRVRAVDTNCNPAQLSLFSSPAVVFVLPETTSDASLLASDLQTVAYQIQLGGELAGQSFTATPNQPWITVVPASGVVPSGGLTLNVTAEPSGLPPGTSIGGVTVTLADAAAGNTQSQGTTTYTTPISVNIVSPASPTAKTSPPPDALIIPAVAHATGINSQFQSDVRVTNTSAETIKYQLSFVPSGEAGMTAGQQTTLNVEPGATVALDDVLKTWFASSTQSTTGTLEIRPLTQSKVSAAPSGTLANLLTFASSRTFNITANGTFGQYIPAIPYAKFVGRGVAGGSDSVLSLQQIAQSDRYRTNLGLVEGSGEPASLMVSVYGKGSAKLLEFPVQLKGGQHLQLNSVLAQHGLTVDDGRIEVKVLSSVGKVTAYASVLDNQTNDPLLVSPHTVSQTGLTSWVVPGIADLANGLANWKTDVRLFNSGTTGVSASVRFYSQRGGEPQSAAVTLEPGETRVLDSVLTTLFNAAGDGGALHVLTQTPARLVATARTYNQTSTGTYGQFIPAVTQAEAAAVGTRPLQILQVEQSERFRTNVGLAEVSGKAVEVEISAIVPGSKVSPILRAKLAANEFRQLNSLLAAMGLGETYNARVTVRAVDGSGRVAAYGSVIDARTQDPTYIPAQ